MNGDLKSAEKHLKALREICSLTCEELTDLERAITSHGKKSPVKAIRRNVEDGIEDFDDLRIKKLRLEESDC
jgi:hypothetical protein